MQRALLRPQGWEVFVSLCFLWELASHIKESNEGKIFVPVHTMMNSCCYLDHLEFSTSLE